MTEQTQPSPGDNKGTLILQCDMCDGWFYVATWLNYSTQLFNQILIQMLQEMCFADVNYIDHQLTLSKEITLNNLEPHAISQKAIRAKWRFPWGGWDSAA